MVELSHADCARENEDVAGELDLTNGPHRNWYVTMQFYAFLHYLESILSTRGFDSDTHRERERNIKECDYVDNQLYRIYRTCYDLSRQARYECVRMDEEAVNTVEERVAQGKQLLGFRDSGGTSKYSAE